MKIDAWVYKDNVKIYGTTGDYIVERWGTQIAKKGKNQGEMVRTRLRMLYFPNLVMAIECAAEFATDVAGKKISTVEGLLKSLKKNRIVVRNFKNMLYNEIKTKYGIVLDLKDKKLKELEIGGK